MLRACAISVIIPACNEEKEIRQNVLALEQYLKRHFRRFEIVVCENGSTDRTFEEARRIKSNHVHVIRSRKGIFYALREGQRHAAFDYMIFFPADLSFSPAFIVDACRYTSRYDLIIGSKAHPQSIVKRPFVRQFMSTAYNRLVRFKYRLTMKDTQGVMLWNRRKLGDCFYGISTDNVLFQPEFILKALQKGAQIKEIPVRVNDLRKKSFSLSTGLSVVKKWLVE